MLVAKTPPKTPHPAMLIYKLEYLSYSYGIVVKTREPATVLSELGKLLQYR
jgi:hypothetical protein